MADLKASSFVFKVPNDLKELVAHFLKDLSEFVSINNEYVKCKIGEEMAKAKKPKMSAADYEAQLNNRYEKITYEKELELIVK